MFVSLYHIARRCSIEGDESCRWQYRERRLDNTHVKGTSQWNEIVSFTKHRFGETR
jgi:hypothetical protein